MFIIDEADQCIIEKGSIVDEVRKQVKGFWQLLEKRTILLSGTISFDLDDILKEVFGIYKHNQVNLTALVCGGIDGACRSHTEYEVVPDDKAYQVLLERTLM